MSSRELLAQEDFSCLGLAAGQDAENQPLDDYDEFGTVERADGLATVERAGSGDSMKSESACEADEIYRPVNFIPDEVYELIRNWERTYHTQQESVHVVDSMEMESSLTGAQASESVYEPMRCVPVSEPPPKRFFRTFRRSVTRRLVVLEKKGTLSKQETRSSDANDNSPSISEEYH